MCGIGVSETPTLFTETHPKARKEHTCCECGGTIKKGDTYQKCSGLWDDFQTFKTCSFCADVRDNASTNFDLNLDEGIPFEQLWECVGMDYAGNL